MLRDEERKGVGKGGGGGAREGLNMCAPEMLSRWGGGGGGGGRGEEEHGRAALSAPAALWCGQRGVSVPRGYRPFRTSLVQWGRRWEGAAAPRGCPEPRRAQAGSPQPAPGGTRQTRV